MYVCDGQSVSDNKFTFSDTASAQHTYCTYIRTYTVYRSSLLQFGEELIGQRVNFDMYIVQPISGL